MNLKSFQDFFKRILKIFLKFKFRFSLKAFTNYELCFSHLELYSLYGLNNSQESGTNFQVPGKFWI